MAITRKPKAQIIDEFVSGAPDAVAKTVIEETVMPLLVEEKPKGFAVGNKRQISLTITPELLKKVDEIAARTGQGSAGIINLAIFKAIEGDIFK